MGKFAVIEGITVLDVIEADAEALAQETRRLVAVGEQAVEAGWLYISGVFGDPAPAAAAPVPATPADPLPPKV